VSNFLNGAKVMGAQISLFFSDFFIFF